MGDPTGTADGAPAPHVVDDETFDARGCGHEIEQVVVCQAYGPLEVDVYSAEMVKGHTWKDVSQGKSVTPLLVELDGRPGLGPKVEERKVNEGVGRTHVSDGRQVCFDGLFRRVGRKFDDEIVDYRKSDMGKEAHDGRQGLGDGLQVC